MKFLEILISTLLGENIIMFKIFSIAFSAIEIYLYSLIMSALLDVKLTYKKQLIFVLGLVIIGILSISFIPYPYHTFVNLLFSILLSILTFKVSILKSTLSTFLFYFMTFFFSIIWLIFFTFLLDCSINIFQQVLLYKIILSITMYLSYYIFYKICLKYSLTLNLLNKLQAHKLLIINLIIGLATLIVQFIIIHLYFDYIPLGLTIFSSILLLGYFFVSIFSLYRTNKLEITTQLLEEEKLYNKTLATLHDNIRGFKHDFNNIIQALGGYISASNMEGLKNYYKDLLEDCQINNNLAALNPEAINNPAIYSLLTDKYYKAESMGIRINLEVLKDLSSLNIKTYELARILGILLDNAIEASAKTDNKMINITFRRDKNRKRDLIIISNSYQNKDVNIDKIFEKGYTSKITEDNASHGLGLWEIRKFLRKNTLYNLYTTKDTQFFTQQFEIYDE